MKYILKIALALMLSLNFLACSEDDSSDHLDSLVQADTKSITKLINGFDNTLKYLSANDTKLSAQDIDKLFINEVSELGIDVKYGSFSSDKNLTTQYSEEYRSFANQIADLSTFSSHSNYTDFLVSLEEKIQISYITFEEKQELINKAVFMNAFVDWASTLENSSLSTSAFDTRSKSGGWWSSWGKCLAGTVGSAITGAGTLGFAGAAVGTVVLPVVGTVSAGVVGAIVGGVGGALVGAATFCGGSNSTQSPAAGALVYYYLNNPQFMEIVTLKDKNNMTFLGTDPKLDQARITGRNRVYLYAGIGTGANIGLYAYKVKYADDFIQGPLEGFQYEGNGNAIIMRIKVAETPFDNICKSLLGCLESI